MATTFVPVNEYLDHSFHPDCDYIDGVLVERNVGTTEHGRLQALISRYFGNREAEWKIIVLVEVRIQVSATRFRIPDVALVLKFPEGPIVTQPPFVCIEILSPDDRPGDVRERVQDYLNFGVKYVWVIDPKTGRAPVYTATSDTDGKDATLRTRNPEMTVSLSEVLASLIPPD